MTQLTLRTLSPDDIVALDDFLKQPDPPDLPRRGHRVTCEGRPDRLEALLVPMIVKATQWRYVAYEWVPTTLTRRVRRAEWVQ